MKWAAAFWSIWLYLAVNHHWLKLVLIEETESNSNGCHILGPQNLPKWWIGCHYTSRTSWDDFVAAHTWPPSFFFTFALYWVTLYQSSTYGNFLLMLIKCFSIISLLNLEVGWHWQSWYHTCKLWPSAQSFLFAGLYLFDSLCTL